MSDNIYFNNWSEIGKRLVKDKDTSIRNYIYYMLNRTQAMFSYNGLPDTIPENMLELMLQSRGLVAIAKHEDKLYAFNGGYGGYPDAYYRPTKFIVANPYLKFNKSLDVFYKTNFDDDFNPDTSCVVIQNDQMLEGMLPLFGKYATLLTENDITLRIADINLRLTTLISAGDDKVKNTALEYLRQIENGNLGVLVDNSFTESLKVIPATASSFSNYLTQLIENEQYLKASWYNEIGINSNFNMKREALNTSETGMNEAALLPLVDNMLYHRKLGLELVNKLFGTNITVDFNSSWSMLRESLEGGELEDESNEAEDDSNDSREQPVPEDSGDW